MLLKDLKNKISENSRVAVKFEEDEYLIPVCHLWSEIGDFISNEQWNSKVSEIIMKDYSLILLTKVENKYRTSMDEYILENYPKWIEDTQIELNKAMQDFNVDRYHKLNKALMEFQLMYQRAREK
jgi:hypothetical protein